MPSISLTFTAINSEIYMNEKFRKGMINYSKSCAIRHALAEGVGIDRMSDYTVENTQMMVKRA